MGSAQMLQQLLMLELGFAVKQVPGAKTLSQLSFHVPLEGNGLHCCAAASFVEIEQEQALAHSNHTGK